MFIECPNCEFKYLVNSADLKPNGRMVECANCNFVGFPCANCATYVLDKPEWSCT